MVTSPQVSWLFFKAVRAGLAVKRPYLSHTGRASNAEKQPTGRGPEGCVENGPAAALLVGYVPHHFCMRVKKPIDSLPFGTRCVRSPPVDVPFGTSNTFRSLLFAVCSSTINKAIEYIILRSLDHWFLVRTIPDSLNYQGNR